MEALQHKTEDYSYTKPQSLGLDISSLNGITPHDEITSENKGDVLIELPAPRQSSPPLMNGHDGYSYDDVDDEKAVLTCQEEYLLRDDGEETETKPFLSQKQNNNEANGTFSRSSTVSESMNTSSSLVSTLVSPSMCPLRELASASSAESEANSGTESDVEVEPESSTHLLRIGDTKCQEYHNIASPKVVKSKLSSFRSSPLANDSRSHIQHRPLGRHQADGNLQSRSSSLKFKWSTVRLGCLALVVSSFVVVACLLIGILITRPLRCEPRRRWWQGSVTYEIFPASFQDTDGDGFGDFTGIISRLDYVQNLSVGVIRLNSIFSALDYPLEYEHVIDFTNVDPHLGRMDDFEQLVSEVHERGMKLILDLNPSVTSDQHTWAAHWLLHRPGRYEHYYINETDNEEEPPLEIGEEYSGKEWTIPHRTFGSHLFLNWSNPLVHMEMRDVLSFWLAQGVDGFYVKHLEKMHVSTEMELLSIFHQWRYLLDKFSVNSTRRILMSSHQTFETLQYNEESSSLISLLPLFDVIDVKLEVSINRTQEIRQQIYDIRNWMNRFPLAPSLSWHLGSVETPRLAGKIGEKYSLAAIFLETMLPSSFSLFYGDEIGMEDSFDIFSKKVERRTFNGPYVFDIVVIVIVLYKST